MIDFKDRVAVVTGGSRGIGASVVRGFARGGGRVVFSYTVNTPAARSVEAEVSAAGGEAIAVQADVSVREESESLVEEATARYGRIDVLVNNAGVWNETPIPIEEMTDDEWDRMMAINLRGVFTTIRAAVPHMKEQRSGRIINVSSTAGQRGEAFHSHYAASKAALFGLTKSLAVELAPHGILVTTVAPGWVDTDMSAVALRTDDRAKVEKTITLGRAGTADEVAGAILFLASDLATYMTACTVSVNGGSVLCV
jgi:3-oxoacyl-[acyl-carrier protein] reductase